MPVVFISYRRDDSAYVADTLHSHLVNRFGNDNVFYDIEALPFGVDFREQIGIAIDQCDVFLAIIGERWVNASDDAGNRRLENPADFVRIEVEAALDRDIRVIPVLVDSAKMPVQEELPESLSKLCYRNAAEVRAGMDLHVHIDRLIDNIDSISPKAKAKPKPKPKPKSKPKSKPKPKPEPKPKPDPKPKASARSDHSPPTHLTALLWHFPLGLGLFYLKGRNWRKWFYPLLPICAGVSVYLARTSTKGEFFHEQMSGGVIYIVLMLLYGLSFIDVFATCNRRQSGAVAAQA